MRAREFSHAKKDLVIFDIDDTLLHTTAKIRVVKDGRPVRELTNQQFNQYELRPGEQFDFGEFSSAEKFNQESQPIEPMIRKLKTILAHSATSKVIMLTARADFDNRELFLKTFTDLGIDMSRVHVHRAGNLPGDSIPAEKKAVYVRRYADTGLYDHIRLYDDSMSNLRVFKDLKKEYPGIDFRAYYVGSTGTTEPIDESVCKKPLKNVYGKSNPGVEIAIFERSVCKQNGISLNEADAPARSNIKYLKSLKKYSVENPSTGKNYAAICLVLIDNRIEIYGTAGIKKLITAFEEDGHRYYQFENDQGGREIFPDKRLSDLSYFDSFLFENSGNYDNFRSSISLKFFKSLPDIDFDRTLSESVSIKHHKKNFVGMFEKFLPLAMEYIGIDRLPQIKFTDRVGDAAQPTFGRYANGKHVLEVALMNRHPNDILRTIAHELTHYKQDTEHQLDSDSGRTGSPIENEANAVAGIVMRHFNKQYPEYLSSKPITESRALRLARTK